VVARGIVEDLPDRLAGVLGDEAEHGVRHVPRVVRLDFDVGGAACAASRGLFRFASSFESMALSFVGTSC